MDIRELRLSRIVVTCVNLCYFEFFYYFWSNVNDIAWWCMMYGESASNFSAFYIIIIVLSVSVGVKGKNSLIQIQVWKLRMSCVCNHFVTPIRVANVSCCMKEVTSLHCRTSSKHGEGFEVFVNFFHPGTCLRVKIIPWLLFIYAGVLYSSFMITGNNFDSVCLPGNSN